jgi:hypothetical protein
MGLPLCSMTECLLMPRRCQRRIWANRRGGIGTLSLTCFLFVVWPALEDTTFEIGIAASDGWDNGCTADVTSPAAGVETNKNKPCNVARCIITDPPATEYGFSFLPPCCTIVPPHHGLTNALGLPVHRVIRD